jgi:hypothetical protein
MINIDNVLASIDRNDVAIDKTMLKFFQTYHDPDQNTINNFLKKENLSLTQFLCLCFKLLNSFASHGRFNESGKNINDFDINQLLKGVKVEKEHTNCKIMARRIAMDHLAECQDYYDRLELMEKECG